MEKKQHKHSEGLLDVLESCVKIHGYEATLETLKTLDGGGSGRGCPPGYISDGNGGCVLDPAGG